jgi:hypothetical protein
VGQVGQGAEEGAELDRQRDADALADRADQLDNAPLDLGAVQLRACSTQPPGATPLRLAITGIFRLALAFSTSIR